MSLWTLALRRLYRSLTRNELPAPSDLIFVFAGRMERKRYGLELYRAGFAPRLLLSVGRFEVSKMPGIGIERTADLIELRDRTPPEQRHFFCEVDRSGVRITKPALRTWNTYGEVIALRDYVDRNPCGSVMIVSTDVHLRRIGVVMESMLRNWAGKVTYCPVPPDYSAIHEHDWWASSDTRKFVLKEWAKLIGYRVILWLPERIVDRIMRLTH